MPRPHILFILTDQQRADCLGVAGHPVLRTPNMDRLAAEGVRFTRCYTTSPLSVPARQSLLRGLYPHNSNAWQNDVETPLDADTYMRCLREAGYRTCGIGKHHLFECNTGDMREREPKYHAIGFDDIIEIGGSWSTLKNFSAYTDYLQSRGLLEQHRAYMKALHEKPDEVRRYIAESLTIPADAYMDAWTTRQIVDYVERYDHDQPSAVYVGYQGPHEPWDAPDEYVKGMDPSKLPPPIPELPQGDWLPPRARWYQRWAQYYPPPSREARDAIYCRYLGKIAQIDDGIGKILAAYERKGWLDNTVIIFTSDHGEMMGDLNRLSKSVCYESAVHTPMIVRMPDRAGAGTTCDGFVEFIDVHGTMLDAAGLPIGKHKDCKSVLPLVRGETRKIRDDVLAEVHAHYMLRTDDWKIVIGRDGSTMCLFDLRSDPLEQKNLCGHPDYARQDLMLRSRLLSRITGSTYRPGVYDPEFSGHPQGGRFGGPMV